MWQDVHVCTVVFVCALDRSQPKAGSGDREKMLVEEITAPGGVRAAPPRDVLNTFITR